MGSVYNGGKVGTSRATKDNVEKNPTILNDSNPLKDRNNKSSNPKETKQINSSSPTAYCKSATLHELQYPGWDKYDMGGR